MYNATTLKTELIGLIGWRQNADSSGTQLTDLTTSESGLYFNDIHPLLTFDNLESVAPDFTGFNLTQWLKEKTESGIIRALEDWIQAKFEVRTAKSLLESYRLFDVANRIDTDTNDSKLVGLEIVPARTRGVKAKIERIGLQFDTAQNITVRLYQAANDVYVYAQTVNYTNANSLQWFDVNWEIDGHGAYYLVYQQSDITGQSINGLLDYVYQAVGYSRSGLYVPYYPAGRYLKTTPFENPGSFGSLDPAQNAYNIGTNYGLNVEVHAYCDYTDFVIRHKDISKGLIQKRVGMDLLREIALNPNSRVNRHESNVNTMTILYEIDGDSQGRKGGLLLAYEKELKAALMDQNQIDKICAPCRKRSVRYGAI